MDKLIIVSINYKGERHTMGFPGSIENGRGYIRKDDFDKWIKRLGIPDYSTISFC